MKKIPILFILLITVVPFFAQEDILHRQNKQIYYIPIVIYEPYYSFDIMVRNILSRASYIDYIKIEKEGNELKCYENIGIETPQGTAVYGPEDKEKYIDTKLDNIDGILENLDKEGLFILNFEHMRRHTKLGITRSILFYGKVTDNGIKLYKNEKGASHTYTLSEAIIEKYGSIEKYKDLLMSNLKWNLDENTDNGIFQLDQKGAIDFFKNDFVLYWECFPEDEEHIYKLFFTFLDKHIIISQLQKQNIRKEITSSRRLLSNVRDINAKKLVGSFPRDLFELFGIQINSILKAYLTDEQYKKIIEEDNIRKILYERYLNGPLRTCIQKMKESNEESLHPVWDNALKSVVLKPVKEEFVDWLTPEETRDNLRKVIFEEKK